MTLLKTWNPCEILDANGIGYNYAVLVLNREIIIPFTKSKLLDLWQNARVRVTVDGGTEQWLLWLEKNNIPKDNIKLPDLVTGDMDSIRPETLEAFRTLKSCRVIVTEDQNETDFTKALLELKKYVKLQDSQVDFIIVLSEDTGRFDQIVANINTLHKAANFLTGIDIYMFTSESLTWLLQTGAHKILVPNVIREYSKWCSLVPMGAKAHVTTTGLKWNLSNSILAFGKMVSTSNAFTNSPEVIITSDNPIVWSMGINSNVINA